MNQSPSPWRAWCYLVWLIFQRQARAHLMVWIALGLLGLTVLIVGIQTQAGRWTMAGWTHPRGKGPTQAMHLENLGAIRPPWEPQATSVQALAWGAYYA